MRGLDFFADNNKVVNCVQDANLSVITEKGNVKSTLALSAIVLVYLFVFKFDIFLNV